MSSSRNQRGEKQAIRLLIVVDIDLYVLHESDEIPVSKLHLQGSRANLTVKHRVRLECMVRDI